MDLQANALASDALGDVLATAWETLREQLALTDDGGAALVEALYAGRLLIVVDPDRAYLLPAAAVRAPGDRDDPLAGVVVPDDPAGLDTGYAGGA